MMDKMAQALEKRFEKHKIVFWFDVKKELRQEYMDLLWIIWLKS